MSLRDFDKNTVILSRAKYKTEFHDEDKERLRNLIKAHVASFLAKGGKINEIEYGMSSRDDKKGIQRLDFKVKNS